MLQNLALHSSFHSVGFVCVSGETFIKYGRVGLDFLNLRCIKKGEGEGNVPKTLPFDGKFSPPTLVNRSWRVL